MAAGQRLDGGACAAPSDVNGARVLVFRPAAVVRWLAWGCAAVCSLGALHVIEAGGRLGPRAVLACILAAPLAGALAAQRRRIVLSREGIVDAHVFGSRQVLWEGVSGVDVRRSEVWIHTSAGCLTTGWIARREALCNAVVQRARLKRVWSSLPAGVIARYTRGAEGFVPHNLRRGSNWGVHATGEGGQKQ